MRVDVLLDIGCAGMQAFDEPLKPRLRRRRTGERAVVAVPGFGRPRGWATE